MTAPYLRTPALGKGGGWRQTLATLRARLQAGDGTDNPHDRAAMSSPPTVNTLAGNTPPTGITQGLRWTDSTILPYQLPLSGQPTTSGTFYENFPSVSVVSGGNTTTTLSTTAWRTAFKVNADKVAFRFGGNTGAKVRFILNGQYLSKTGHAFAGTSGSQYLYFNLPSLGEHHLIVEGALNQLFDGIYVPSGQTVYLEDSLYPDIALVLGESFTSGTGNTYPNDMWAVIAAERLRYNKIWCSGLGSTGYVANGSGSSYKLADRIAVDIQRAKDLGTVSLVIVAMGINDAGLSGVQAQVESCLSTIRTMLPAAVVLVTTGPWDTSAPSAPAANYTAVKAAIIAGIGTRPGVIAVDMQGTAYTLFDTIHPDDAGHVTLGQAFAAKARTAIG